MSLEQGLGLTDVSRGFPGRFFRPATENCSTAKFVFGAGGLLLLSASSKSWPVAFLDGAWGLRRGSNVGAYLQLQLKLI